RLGVPRRPVRLRDRLLDDRVQPRTVGPPGVVAQEDDDLAQFLGVQLPCRQRGRHLDAEDVRATGAREQPDEQQPTIPVGQPGSFPDVGEQVVGGVAEEVTGAVGHVEPVDLLHPLQPAAPGLRQVVELAHQCSPPVCAVPCGAAGGRPSPGASRARASAASGTSTPSRSARSTANPRSFSPSARTWSKTPYQKSSGSSGAVLSRCMIAPGPPVIVSVWRTTSPSALRSRPAASASRCASVAAVKATKCSMLRASLNFVPAPTGPACTTFDPITRSAGAARSKACSSAPTMIASVPSAAPIGPPDTGASRTLMPCRAAVSASSPGV